MYCKVETEVKTVPEEGTTYASHPLEEAHMRTLGLKRMVLTISTLELMVAANRFEGDYFV